MLACILIFSFASIIRIFERPYYTFNFTDQGLTFYNFDYLSSSLWFTIITMTSVGYGGIIASTQLGRFATLISTIVGAFLLSLLVAIITEWFAMEERQEKAIDKMRLDQFAVEAVKRGLQYNAMRAKRYRMLREGGEKDSQDG